MFALIEDEKKFIQINSKVIFDTCIECGSIENIRVENPKKIVELLEINSSIIAQTTI